MKLTNDMKKMIRDGLMNDAYTNAELAEIKASLAKEIRKHPYIRKGVDILRRYPSYVFETKSVSLAKRYWEYKNKETHDCMFNLDTYAGTSLDIDVMFAYRSGQFIVAEKVEELTEKGQELWDRLIDYCNGKAKLRDDIDTILKGVNTSKQLVDILPEAKKYIPEENPSAIVPIEVINRAKEVINERTKAV